MPGIVGIISRGNPEECMSKVRSMVESMKHERSYVTQTCFVPELGIYAGWLAHPGSFATRHCGRDERTQTELVFSGECFGDQSAIDSTAGWIGSRYEKQGQHCIENLNGLFSGLLIDHRSRRAFLFNDRYGVERIYVHETDDATYFASEAKALLQVLSSLRAFDEAGVAQFLAFGCTMEGKTLFRGVSLLPGGSLWSFEPGKSPRRERYFVPDAWETQTSLTGEEFENEVSETFQRILPRYLASEEGLGISLTGGLDTRMIMACLRTNAAKAICYTFSGQAGDTLDARLAARIAAIRSLKHQVLRIGQDFLKGFATHVDRTVLVTDGCGDALRAHEMYFNAQGRQLAPIRLTGNFGSEVLRSMSTFKPLALAPGLLQPKWETGVATAAECTPSTAVHPVTFSAFREIPWNLFGTLAAGRSQLTFRTPYLDNELVALAYRAPMGMRTSPLPALKLIHKSDPVMGNIPTDRGEVYKSRGLVRGFRRLYAEVTFKLDYLHKEGLPGWLAPLDPMLNSLSGSGLLGLHKFLPYRRWFQN